MEQPASRTVQDAHHVAALVQQHEHSPELLLGRSLEEVERRFKEYALLLHPDKGAAIFGLQRATALFQALKHARHTLKERLASGQAPAHQHEPPRQVRLEFVFIMLRAAEAQQGARAHAAAPIPCSRTVQANPWGQFAEGGPLTTTAATAYAAAAQPRAAPTGGFAAAAKPQVST